MATIHYGLSGEGRGHAGRARTLTTHLSVRHDVVLHAPGDARDLLSPLFERHPRVAVRPIDGLRWSYDALGRVAYVRSAAASLSYLSTHPSRVAGLARVLEEEQATLVLSDFEPALCRAARKAGCPLVTLDHQGFLTSLDLSDLPRRLRARARFMATFVERWSPTPDLAVVSSFFRHRPAAGREHVRHVGVLLRPAIRDAQPTLEGHVLAYLRPGAPESALDALRRSPLEVRLYGRGPGPREGALVRKAIDEVEFARDLAGCEALVSTAGNQLVGEALHLGKPVLVAPEPGNMEQELNAWFLADSGGGEATTFEQLDLRRLEEFLERREDFARVARGLDVDGTSETLALLAPFLDSPTDRVGPPPVEAAPRRSLVEVFA